jgi:hypothetical protein
MINVLENKILGPAIRQGLAMGEARGEAKGMWRLLERQMERRFGPMPGWALDKLHSASPEVIEGWSDRLADAKTLEEISSL